MRTKIDYGIYLGTSFCQWARMENDTPLIKKTDVLKDSLPLCVAINRRRDIITGNPALNIFRSDKASGQIQSNSFTGFMRTLGTTHVYESSNLGKSFTLEELLAECFKKLCSLITDEDFKAVVITVQSKYLDLQLQALSDAAALAGFDQKELLHGPLAMALAYGVKKNDYSVGFNFENDDFEVSLMKGQLLIDNENDSRIGGQSIVEAIVDQIILPNLASDFAIDSLLADIEKIKSLRNTVSFHAEEAKINMFFNASYHILSGLGDLQFEDENGNELEIDVIITQQDIAWVSRPIYQKAIDITIDLLKRNNLKGKGISTICLAGEETFSPLLRQMLREQISDIYASTISVSGKLKQEIDRSKIQLDIHYEGVTVELYEMISIKISKTNLNVSFPRSIFANIISSDGSWSSGKIVINERAIILDVPLIENAANVFNIELYDNFGGEIACEPNSFNIEHNYLSQMQLLPYHIGTAKYIHLKGKNLIIPIKGLEKNNGIPAIGFINGFKTKVDLRPGIGSNVIKIPRFQGDHDSERTNPFLNNYVMDIVITGEHLPAFLPAGSDNDITIKLDKSQLMHVSVYIPDLDYTEPIQIEMKPFELTLKDIDKLKEILITFYADNPVMGKDRFRFLLKGLTRIEKVAIPFDERIHMFNTIKNELLKWQ